jgi:hypothetical protein
VSFDENIKATVGEAKREPISDQLIRLSQNVATRADKSIASAEIRLAPVARERQDSEPSFGEAVNETWPPLFEDLRMALWSIERALGRFDDLIDRVEV